jgi:peptide deformylase
VQHETDHLDGILFIDRLDREQRKLAMRAIREAEWSGQPAPQVRVSPHATHGRAL